jgi:Na+-translocating ferredoxin:NAD+ oxidoreductase RnfD subunit
MRRAEESASQLQSHIESTYHSLRMGIAVIGLTLPLLLWLGGTLLSGVALRGSMSAYYYTSWRDVFVGGLCAIGVALYLYKGFSRAENWALSAAGVLAVCVAVFPTRSGDTWTWESVVHVVSAVLFFLCLAYTSLFRASDTLSLVRDTTRATALQR